MAESQHEYPADGGWEYQLSPERAQLKETASLLVQVMHTVEVADDPKKLIAGYAEEFLKLHLADLPPAVVQELAQRRLALLIPPSQESTQQ